MKSENSDNSQRFKMNNKLKKDNEIPKDNESEKHIKITEDEQKATEKYKDLLNKSDKEIIQFNINDKSECNICTNESIDD